MYETKLKKEIFEKLIELNEVVEERDEIEEDTGLTYRELIYECEDTNYGCLCHREMQIIDDVKKLLRETKYAPLTELTNEQMRELSFYIESINREDSVLQSEIESNLNWMLLRLKDSIKERERQIIPFCLTGRIDSRDYHFYQQAIKCYVYGLFEASCVLCRAIAEDVAKRLIEKKGYGDLLKKGKNNHKQLSLFEILKEKLLINNEVVDLYSKIAKKANKILHEKNETTEEKNALESIKLLQAFINKIAGLL